MPEIISKYPDIVLQVLSRAGIDCGTGAAQKILTSCPAEKFCSLPSGEICVYGLNEIPQMTQVSNAEIAQIVSIAPKETSILTTEVVILIILALVLGIILGILLNQKIKKKNF